MSTLAGLLQIKEFRESRAEREVARAREQLVVAEQRVEQARTALRDYLKFCDTRERQLFQDLMSRLVHKSDFDDLEAEIKAMREKVPDYEQAVEKAVQAREQARARLDEARQAHQLAMRMREKFSELVRQAKEDMAMEALRAEDRELEDLPRGRRSAGSLQEESA